MSPQVDKLIGPPQLPSHLPYGTYVPRYSYRWHCKLLTVARVGGGDEKGGQKLTTSAAARNLSADATQWRTPGGVADYFRYVAGEQARQALELNVLLRADRSQFRREFQVHLSLPRRRQALGCVGFLLS